MSELSLKPTQEAKMSNKTNMVISEILDDVLIPQKLPSRQKSELTKTLEQLEVGQSFALTGVKKRSEFAPHISNIQKKYGAKFTTRKVDGGFRIWRVE